MTTPTHVRRRVEPDQWRGAFITYCAHVTQYAFDHSPTAGSDLTRHGIALLNDAARVHTRWHELDHAERYELMVRLRGLTRALGTASFDLAP